MKEIISKEFTKIFNGHPRIFQAPGRVNLIGEHTDYNCGFVFPMAIDRFTYVALKKRKDRKFNVYSKNFNEIVNLDLDSFEKTRIWADYVLGVAWALESEGFPLSGADIYIQSEVPLGAGLSSSAAIEVSTALALTATNNKNIEKKRLAKICQKAENEFVGMKCGIMDQFISCFGKKDNALLLDCRSLEYNLIPVNTEKTRIIVCNTMVKHELGSSEYNKRRKECEEGVNILKTKYPEINSLRDADIEKFNEMQKSMPETVRKRCRHVITENERVMNSIQALKKNNMAKFGEMLNGSHNSLRDDYEVSCKELDIMVNAARGIDGVYGARVTGGGFGGCTVNLIKSDKQEIFIEEIKKMYNKETGLIPDVYSFLPSEGAKEI